MLSVMAGLVLAVFAAEKAPAAPAQGTPEPLAEELRAADQKYRRKLDAILRLAEIQDDSPVRIDVKRRQAATAKYQSVGMPRVERKLTIRGNFSGDPALAVYDSSIGWSGGTYPSGLTANGQAWARPKEDWAVCMEEIVRWKSAGKITVRLSSSEATGTPLFEIETDPAVYRAGEPAMLQIVYRTRADRAGPIEPAVTPKDPLDYRGQALSASLAEKLRAADRDYRGKLEGILKRAEREDDKAVKADVDQRQAATGQYKSSVEALEPAERGLTITGDMLRECKLVVQDDYLYWDGFFFSGDSRTAGPSLLTANGQVWGRGHLPVRIREIVRWKSAGNVKVRSGTEGNGAQFFEIVSKGRSKETGEPFMLQFVYKTDPTRNTGGAQPARKPAKKEPVAGK